MLTDKRIREMADEHMVGQIGGPNWGFAWHDFARAIEAEVKGSSAPSAEPAKLERAAKLLEGVGHRVLADAVRAAATHPTPEELRRSLLAGQWDWSKVAAATQPAPSAERAVRMLTDDEFDAVDLNWASRPDAVAIQRKFIEVNGLATATQGAPAPAPEHSPILQLAGDRCQCARCVSDRATGIHPTPPQAQGSEENSAGAVRACRYTNKPGGACWRKGKAVELCTCHGMTDEQVDAVVAKNRPPTAVDAGKTVESAASSDLHHRVMNLPVPVRNWAAEFQAPDVAQHCHAMGHRDARHAAAELVAASSAMGDDGTTKATRDVLAERARQISVEGWTPQHDDDHDSDEIAAAAAYYAMPQGAREWPATETGYGDTLGEAIAPTEWVMKDYGDRRRELVVAAALLLAEIERLDRAASPSPSNERKDK